jgi:hypothetical protein
MLRRSMLLVAVIVAASGLLMAGENPKFVTGEVLLGYLETTVPPQMRFMGTQRISGRSEVQVWEPVSPSDSVAPFITGPITFVVNCNFDSNYRGPCWGTFEWEAPEVGGMWEGTWTTPVMDLVTYESKISIVGHGMGGEIDGKQIKLDGGSAPGDWYITATVRIK